MLFPIYSKPAMSKDVYASIKGLVNGQEKYYYANQEFDATSAYFMIYEISNIPKSVFDANINVTPQWETLDGTIVKGTPNTVKISDVYTDQVTENPDGSVTIENRGNNWVQYNFDIADKNLKAGDVVSVTYSLANVETVWSALFVNGVEKRADNVNGTRKIDFTLTEECTSLYILVKNFNVTEWNNMVTINPLQIGRAPEFSQGVTFESIADITAFNKGNYGTLTTTSYAAAGIEPLNDAFGSTVLKAANTGANHWPAINVTFDKEYPAGSVLRVWVYAQASGVTASNTYWTEFYTYYNSGTDTDYQSQAGHQFNKWVMYEVTFKRASNVGTLRLNIDNSALSNYAITVYMDNFQITESSTYSLTEGVSFEKAAEFSHFVNKAGYKSIALESYDSAGIVPHDSSFGEVALKGINANNNMYPRVEFDLGKEYPAGTVISAWVYVKADQAGASNKYALQTWGNPYSNDAIVQQSNFAFNTWVYFEAALKNTASVAALRVHLEFCGLSDKNVTVYMDNFKIHVSDFEKGVGFENSVDTKAFSAIAYTSLTPVSYASAGITPYDATFGNTALVAVNGSSNNYPRVHITLDKEYAAGSKISAWVYVKADGATETNKYSIESWSKTYAPASTVVTKGGNLFNTWVYYEGELKEDTNVADLRVHLEYCGLSNKNVTVYMDNFKIIPAQ